MKYFALVLTAGLLFGAFLYAGTDRNTQTNTLEFLEADPGTEKITIQPPALAGDLTFTLPDNDGNAGEAVISDGAGGLSFSGVLTNPFTGALLDLNPASGAIELRLETEDTSDASVSLRADDGGTLRRWDVVTDSAGNFEIREDGTTARITLAEGGNLTVNSGNITSTSGIITAGDEFRAGDDGFLFSSGLGTGMLKTAANQISFNTNSINQARINSDGTMELSIREDGSCGLGTVCTNNAIAGAGETCVTNCDGCSVTEGIFLRAGDTVIFAFQMNIDPSSAGTRYECRFDPFVASAFSGTGQAHGNCRDDTSSGGSDNDAVVFSDATNDDLIVRASNPDHTTNRVYRCNGMYRIL